MRSACNFLCELKFLSLSQQDETIEKRSHSLQQLGTKVEMVYNLLSMLSTHDREKMTKTLLLMTNSPDSCMAMRKSGLFIHPHSFIFVN